MSADNPVEEQSRRRRRRRGGDEAAEEEETNIEAVGGKAAKNRATPGRRTTTDEGGGNFITRSYRATAEYLKGVKDELDKVVWPSRADTVRLSRIVLIVTIIASMALGLLSFMYTELFRFGFANELVFVVAFVAAGIGAFVIRRIMMRSLENPPF